jgi:exo-beta-1,3-glucanase (GH17 family)
MKTVPIISLILVLFISFTACKKSSVDTMTSKEITAKDILGNPEYRAIAYGGYRDTTLEVQPTIAELKEDMKILSAIGIKIIRTYKVYLDEAENLCKAIRELREEDPNFEMYMMMGAWIDAKYAWTDHPERIRYEDAPRNHEEIKKVIRLANEYPDIVKIIAVGNEAMVHWATEYYVDPEIILNWVEYLQEKKQSGELPKDVWITSSDNFASWGGGDPVYHTEDLNALIEAVDYISLHTYPMHDTHYNPVFWGVPDEDAELTDREKIDNSMIRARDYAIAQYDSVVSYMKSLGVDKPVHIGESGWATISNEFYGASEARAIDEYKMAKYHDLMREWTDANNISLFYFEAFDEQWKDAQNPDGSENHFGLINLKSQAKYVLWDAVDKGVFEGLTRDGKPITKTFNGDFDKMWETVLVPPTEDDIMSRVGAAQ